MTQRYSTTPRRWLALIALLALGAWLLLGTDVFAPATRDADSDRDTRIENADMLEADSDAVRAPHGELVGDPQSAARRTREGAHRGPVTVTVLGPNRVPLPNVFVIVAETEREGPQARLRDARTDAAGRAHFVDVRYDGGARVLLAKQLDPTGAGGGFLDVGSGDIQIIDIGEGLKAQGLERVCWTKVSGATATLHSPVGLVIDVQAVDGSTGRRLRGLKGGVWPAFGGLGGKVAPRGAPAAIERGMGCRYLIALAPPEGYVQASPVHVRRPIHPDVKRATHVVALRHEAEFVLVAKPGTTLPPTAGSELRIGLGHQYRAAQFQQADGFGRVRVEGIPFVPHVPVDVYWEFASGGYAAGKGRFGTTHVEGLVVELNVYSPSDVTDVPEEIEESVETDNDLEHFESFGNGAGTAGPAPVRVILDIKRPDGAPASLSVAEFGSVKTMIRPSDKGRRDWSVLPGEHEVLVWGAGADLWTRVEIGPDPTQEVSLQGTEGGRLRVSLRDTEGRELPHASVTIVGPANWAQSDVKSGHQRLDSLTDVHGTRTFHRVAVGRCQVHMRYGGFYVTKAVDIREGRTTKLDLEMDLSR
ncbi:MAG: carboxypeptidase regulatory-like domain-containing protein [bacterium]|nr:carboxypeptidase regulatory-like domain-containing protein [bacterium]